MRKPKMAMQVDGAGRRHADGPNRERGASLVLALAFLVGIGVMVAALLTYADTATRTQKNFRAQRSERYAADAALEDGIGWARDLTHVGIDDGQKNCALNKPATADTPALLVTCEPEAGSGSGLPTQVGDTPEYAILTLGQRDKEPPPTRGESCILETVGRPGWDPTGLRGGNRREYGIRFSKATTVCVSTRPVNSWQVKGKVFSNSPIAVNPGGGIELVGAGSSVQARGGCINVACTDPGRTNLDPMRPAGNGNAGQDPRTDSTATAAKRDSWKLPNLTGLPKRSVPPVSACSAGQTVTFEPGWYDDANALNALFKASACKGKTFWFAPARGTDGNLLGANYQQGLYYFDFTTSWNGGCNWFNDNSTTKHQWCIGDDYDHNQTVIGGTPLGWSPFAQSGGGTPTIEITQSQVDSFGTTFWNNSGNATKIDGNVASYNNEIVAIDRPITLKNFSPKVASGAYNASAFNIKVAHNTPNKYSAPKLTVSYDSSLFGSKNCGTFTLNKGDYLAVPDQLKVADQQQLARCLNHGDKINTVKVRWNVGGCNFFCFGNPPRLDGMTLVPDSYPDQPQFPSSASCDATKPGVQFIFGGDSHVYVADGQMELCAGPAADDPATPNQNEALTSQQIAFYGVPAVEPLRPTTVAQASGGNTTGTASRDNAKRIAEPEAADRGDGAAISYGTGNCGFCSKTIKGGLTLTFPAASIPAGTEVKSVRVRAAYNSHGIFTGPELELPGCGTMGFGASHGIPQIDGNTQATKDADCLKTAVTTGFTATWWARATVVCGFGICGQRNFTDHLDGVEIIIDVQSKTPNAASGPVPVPNGGCVYGAPNYWGASQGGDGTCAIIMADRTANPFNSSQDSRGKFSALGTIYTPSAAISIDDDQVEYPFFGRGLVARTLMFRGFKYKNKVPVGDVPPIDKSQKPRQVLFQACTRPGLTATDTRPCGSVAGDTVMSRALVRYEVDKTVADVTKRARIPKVVWWSLDR